MFSIHLVYIFFFFFNDTATTEIYTLSLHDALPILSQQDLSRLRSLWRRCGGEPLLRQAPRRADVGRVGDDRRRSEEHTSELQSRRDLVCHHLLEKKKKNISYHAILPLLNASHIVHG